MATLLALINCHSRPGYANAQRETWIPKIPQGLDYKFFLGPSDRAPRPDEVFLNCRDDYGGLPNKVQEVVRWTLEHGYENMAKIDDDVILKPAEFLSSGFQQHDFVGHTNNDRSVVKIPWGFLYTLSRKAMENMAISELPRDFNDEAWCANTLAYHGILLHHEPRYVLHRGKRSDFIVPTKRPLRAPKPRFDLNYLDVTDPSNGIAYCVFLHWLGYHATPDDVNIREYYKLFKETQ
jgi:hypothetical protein